MAAKVETDAVTGVDTTGHEWDGIRELDNPLPTWWVYTFYASIGIAVLLWILYPSWPLGRTYLGGILNYNERLDLDDRMAAAAAAQSQWRDRLAVDDVAQIQADPDLRQFAIAGGEVAFKTNCAPCHGLGGAGQGFFPTLADDDWLWGGGLEQIEYTIRHGIRNGQDPDARDTAMPAFGADGLLDQKQIADVTQYILSLSGASTNAEAVERGAPIFAENCSACHGEDGGGMQEMGAPSLKDAIWLYGSTPAQIAAQIYRPRLGAMPTWQGRLDDQTIKMLTVYVHSLGGGQ